MICHHALSQKNALQVLSLKLNRISIDKEAIERGSPTDPETMSSFISQIIEEEQIWAHRVGIILPPQAALSQIIHLPDYLNYNDAIDYVKPNKVIHLAAETHVDRSIQGSRVFIESNIIGTYNLLESIRTYYIAFYKYS